MGYDVGYHSLKPMYEGQQLRHPTKMVIPKGEDIKTMAPEDVIKKIKFRKKGAKPPVCEWLGKPCYCDGSALAAEEYMNVLVKEGSDKIWEMLEKEYKQTFGK